METQNYNTKSINIDKKGKGRRVLKDRVIQVTEPGLLSDCREHLSTMLFKL